jgi:anti-sigma-K factor RskA
MGILNSGGSNTIVVSNQSASQLSSATGQTLTVSWLPNGGT